LKEDINAITGFNITQIFVSLSDESHYAIAQIIIEKQL
jgi:phosphopantetheinyl transferase (holo-ACP synthase)